MRVYVILDEFLHQLAGAVMWQAVHVQLELGHRSILRSRPTPEGFTHDWVVYVRGSGGSNIQHFVDKVKFHLHESFPKSKRGQFI